MSEYYEDFVRSSSQISNEYSEDEIYEEFGEQLYESKSETYEEENEYEDFDPEFRRRSLSHGTQVAPNKTFIKGLREKFNAGSKGGKLGALLKDKQLLSQQVKKLTHFPFPKKSNDVTQTMTLSTPSSSKKTRTLERVWRKQGFYNSSTSAEKNAKEEVDNMIYRSSSPDFDSAPRSPRYPPKPNNLPFYEKVDYDWATHVPLLPHNSSTPSNENLYTENPTLDHVVHNSPPNRTKPQPQLPTNSNDFKIKPSTLNQLMKQIQDQVNVRDASNVDDSTNYGKPEMTSPIQLDTNESELYDRLSR